ncbi:unnamed protein product [Paramecium primaurelia]|uniref:Uncharacterized protein n=2 Tax=Paramecium TaxID=5884 RepID=A0A8S1XT17_9CILI|nr:unnamed protein product [Paramecium primaurelia]CAD8203908.1 unnamed protein product [Paramecium pentaurelia]
MFSEIIPSLMDYSQHLDRTIKEVQQQILQMETITNKTNSHKRPLEMKYLQHKSSVPSTLPDINNDIDKILLTAEQFLSDPNKTQIEPKKQEKQDFEQPKRKIESYKQPTNKKQILSRKVSQKKLSPSKVSMHKRSGSLYKQEVTPKVTQVQPKFPIQQRESTKSFKDQSRLIKQSPTKSIHEKNSILIEDQSKVKPPIPAVQPIRKQPSQPYLQLQPIPQQQQQQQNLNSSYTQAPINNKMENNQQQQQNALKKFDFNGYKELSRLKRMKDAIFVEYQQSYTYFREKEQKSRARFLTKFHQHMNERKKLLQQSAYGDRQTFFFLSDQIHPQYFSFIEEQLTIGQPKTLLILKYCEQIQKTIDSIEFDDELLKNLKRANKQNISKISLTELVEVFKLWSQVQIIRQNYQQLTQFIQPIPELTYDLIQWICLRPKIIKKDKTQIQLSQKVIRYNQFASSQEEALETNKLIIKEEIFRFLWDIIQKLVFSQQQLETSMALFKSILKFLTKNNCSVYVYKNSDLFI